MKTKFKRKKINFMVVIFLEQYFKEFKKINFLFIYYFKGYFASSLSFLWAAVFCVNDASHKRTVTFIWFVGKICKYISTS